MWEIKGKDGVVKTSVHSLEYNGEWMGSTYVTTTIESPSPIGFEIGDYLEYRGEHFEINYDPGKIKTAQPYKKGDAFKYDNVKFNSLADELTRCEFLDVVLNDNKIHFTGLPKFTFFGTARDLANRIQANLNRAYPGKWSVIVHPEYTSSKELNVSVDKLNVWKALEILVDNFETYFTIKGRTITIGAAGLPAKHLFKYGRGNGLYEIEQNAEADQAIVTRLRAYGSTRNLPHRYYADIPEASRAHANIFTVLERHYTNIGGVSCLLTFIFEASYIDPSKCFKQETADGNRYWLNVTINGATYAAYCDASKSPQQITMGSKPPKGFRGSSNWILRKSEMDAIVTNTPVAFDCYTEHAPGIIEGQHIPDNMAVNFLMLPGFPEVTFDPYIDSPNAGALGIREGSVFFDGSSEGLEEIYPSIEDMAAEQLTAAGLTCNSTGALDELTGASQITDNGIGERNESGDSEKITPATFKIYVKDLGFDINNYLTTDKATVSFKTGKLGGRDFEIVENGCKPIKNDSGEVVGYELELNRIYDDGIKLWFPYKDYNAKNGDKFVLLHIDMPDVYIKAASQRLLEAAQKWLAKNDYSRSVYALKVDEIFMARQHDAAMASNGTIESLHDTLCAGMLMLFEDEDLKIDASIVIDRLIIKEEADSIPTYEVTLREDKSVGRLDRMQNQIDSLASGQGQGAGYTAAQIRAMIEAYGAPRFLSKIKDDRTPYSLGVGGLLTAAGGAQFGSFTSGTAGGAVDELGNGELESLDVRSFLRVYELVVNRQRIWDSEVLITEGDTIEEVLGSGPGTDGAPAWATLKMRPQWEGYRTALREGDILRGIFLNKDIAGGATSTDLSKPTLYPEDEGYDKNGTVTANGTIFATAWMWVSTVFDEPNKIGVLIYPDAECPAKRNHPPLAGMSVARWGNRYTEEDVTAGRIKPEDLTVCKRRRSHWVLSSPERRILCRHNVTSPVLDPVRNIACSLGKVPEFLFEPPYDLGAHGLTKEEHVLYADRAVISGLIRVDKNLQPLGELTLRGDYDPEAQYYAGTLNSATGIVEISIVSFGGSQYTPTMSGKGSVLGVPGTTGALWTVFTEKGKDGKDGEKGADGKDGSSYTDNLVLGSEPVVEIDHRKYQQKTYTLAENVGLWPDGTKYTVSFDYEYENFTTGSNHFLGFQDSVRKVTQANGTTYNDYFGGWFYLGENQTGISGKGRFTKQMQIPSHGEPLNLTSLSLFMPSNSKGTMRVSRVKVERGWNDNAVWTPNPLDLYGPKGDKGDKGDNGEDGQPGVDGVGIVSTEILYGRSESNAIKPTSWQSDIPAVPPGEYLWMKTTWHYSDGTDETGYSVARQGSDGQGYTPNLLKGSNVKLNDQANYRLGQYEYYEVPAEGEDYTLSICFRIGAKDDELHICHNNGGNGMTSFYANDNTGERIEHWYFKGVAPGDDTALGFFHLPYDGDFDPDTYVVWATVTRGRTPQDTWIPSPEDMTGTPGRGIVSVEKWYDATDSATAPAKPDDYTQWESNLMATGYGDTYHYLWSVTVIKYTDGTTYVSDVVLESIAGLDGAQGQVGPYVPTPRLWDDYPIGYTFMQGAEGEPRKDVVLVEDTNGKLIPWSCIRTHTNGPRTYPYDPKVPGDTPPAGSGLETLPYWKQDGGVWEIIATKVLLAQSAYIDLMSANGIRIHNKNGQIVGALTDATSSLYPLWLGGVLDPDTGAFTMDPNWAVRRDGTQLLGSLAGARIMINPKSREIAFYDAERKRRIVMRSGTVDLASIFPNTPSCHITLPSSGKSFSSSTSGTLALGGVPINLRSKGEYAFRAEIGYSAELQDAIRFTGAVGVEGDGWVKDRAELDISVKLYYSEYVAQYSRFFDTLVDENGVTLNPDDDGTQKCPNVKQGGKIAVSGTFTVPNDSSSDTYCPKIKMTVTYTLRVDGNALGTLEFTTANGHISANADQQTFIGSNGVIVAQSADSYLRSGLVGGKVEHEMVTGGMGVKVTSSGVTITAGGSGVTINASNISKLRNLLES